MNASNLRVADLNARLAELHPRTAETPMFNPVFQLALEVSRKLESGELGLDAIESLVAEMECEGLRVRAARLARTVGPMPPPVNDSHIDALANEEDDFTAFAVRWQRPAAHVVFTAHPTFLHNRAQSAAIVEAASIGDFSPATVCVAHAERDAITLDYEHAEAMAALSRGQTARDRINERLFSIAAARFPKKWRSLQPVPFRFAHWVGYDMDGRTDISWATSIRYRLEEKALRLARYAEALNPILPAVAEQLQRATAHTQEMAQRFAADLSAPEDLSSAANALSADHADKIISLTPIISRIEDEARHAETDLARKLLVVAAAMHADGLGMGGIHFRVNSSQLQNAIRLRIDPNGTLDLASQAALVKMRELLADVKPLTTNFAALAIENSTAVRQFIAMAQILTHVDADAPIRMLVAECEQPTTVLAALYFAEMFGVSDKVDVSPLFETETALEHGGRFIDAVLAEPAYRAYARRRGRVSVQAGFSDAGRFVGQIPAALAIERLQGRLADSMVENGLTDVSALVFNTGGESMGRGCHPSSMADRLHWQMSPWARKRFLRANVRLEPEISFQGGDGYLWFGSEELAMATLTRLVERPLWATDVSAPNDPFYQRTDLSLDFYRSIRNIQHTHLESRSYSRAITAFGLGLLNDTGSRKARRQSDIASDRTMSLRQIRAIPHNAILQQLGYPVNVITGVGAAASGNVEDVAALLRDSARGRALIRLVRAANAVASIKTVAAFGELFNSAYWASRPYRGDEPHIADGCLRLADYLTSDDRNGVFRRLGSRLRVDALKLHRLLALIPDDAPQAEREGTRRNIGALQALRLALFQHMFLRSVMVPPFSRANDISHEDVMEMFLTLRVEEGLAQLRRAFPVHFPSINDFQVQAPCQYPDSSATGYAAIHTDFIDPIARSYSLSLRIGAAIADEFGAHG